MKKLYGDVAKYFDNGRNQIFGRVYGIITLALQVAIYLKLDGISETSFANKP